MKKYKRCPRCEMKNDLHAAKCLKCGLVFSRLELATNAEAKIAYKNNEKDRVVLSPFMPADINKVKFILWMCLLGWFGAHNLYVGKRSKGLYGLISMSLVFVVVGINMYLTHEFGSIFIMVYAILPIFGFAGVGSILIWAMDVIKYLTRSYLYPVSLPPKKKDGARGIDVDKVLKEEEELEIDPKVKEEILTDLQRLNSKENSSYKTDKKGIEAKMKEDSPSDLKEQEHSVDVKEKEKKVSSFKKKK